MTADKTGAATTVTAESGRFTIAVDGRTVGLADFSDRDGRRTFFHTETADGYEGRGLATILVAEALRVTSEADLRIVAPCSMVAAYVAKHPEFDHLVENRLNDRVRTTGRRTDIVASDDQTTTPGLLRRRW